jgi:hypothetical protein
VELQSRYADITKQGLGLIAISYDAPETHKRFSDSRGITFPMITDAGSAIIKQYGLLNDTMDPKSRFYGVPHPGTFIVDRQGVVVSRFFEDAYQERYTAATILGTLGAGVGGPAVSANTLHLTMTASISDAVAAPGERLAITVNVTPKPGMHLYAPGKHDYQVVQLTLDPQPWLRPQATIYPASEIYHFKPLDERVEVFIKPFRLQRDLTLLATPEAQKLLGAMASVTITGALEYQACDDKVCFNPARVPFSFTIALKSLDRRPPGER